MKKRPPHRETYEEHSRCTSEKCQIVAATELAERVSSLESAAALVQQNFRLNAKLYDLEQRVAKEHSVSSARSAPIKYRTRTTTPFLQK